MRISLASVFALAATAVVGIPVSGAPVAGVVPVNGPVAGPGVIHVGSTSPRPRPNLIVNAYDKYEFLCIQNLNNKPGKGRPLRKDCESLRDWLKYHNRIIDFTGWELPADEWLLTFGIGTCSIYAHTSSEDNINFTNGDLVHFLATAMKQPWTVDLRMSASASAVCPAEHRMGNVEFRLQNDQDKVARSPLVVETLNSIPQNASAYVLPDKNEATGNHVTNSIKRAEDDDSEDDHDSEDDSDSDSEDGYDSEDDDAKDDDTKDDDGTNGTYNTLARRFQIYTDGNPTGPFCDPMWMSADWEDNSKTPVKSDCHQLLDFCKKNKASVVFKERDLDFWAKFAAHGTCGIMFKTTQAKIMITNRDMAGFLDRALRYDAATTADDGLQAKMGVRCGYVPWNKYDGEFRLFWRDPTLPIGKLERRDSANVQVLSAGPHEPTVSLANWVDVSVITKDGKNITAQVNSDVLAAPAKLATRLEYTKTPMGPSKRCTGKTRWWGGAHDDSATIEDCKHLREFVGSNDMRMYWQFSDQEVRNGRLEPVQATPVAKYETCHFAFAPRYHTVIGNMDVERIVDGAIAYLGNTNGRMRGWGEMACDLDDQFGNKAEGYWTIYP